MVESVVGTKKPGLGRAACVGWMSDMAALRQGARLAGPDNDVIQNAYVDKGQSVLQAPGDMDIGLAGLRVTGGVIVRLMCPVFLCVLKSQSGMEERFLTKE